MRESDWIVCDLAGRELDPGPVGPSSRTARQSPPGPRPFAEESPDMVLMVTPMASKPDIECVGLLRDGQDYSPPVVFNGHHDGRPRFGAAVSGSSYILMRRTGRKDVADV